MKAVRTLLTLLCAVALLLGTVPAVAAAKAPGGDFAWTDSKSPLLIEQILQRDGLIDGIWFPWFDGGNVGHSLTGNDLMVRYRGNGWSKVAMDTVGADKIYREIYNLKAMGYNLLGYGGSIYDEGVIHDAYGDVIGVKQEFLDNARRLLDMCREIGMPVMWTICFHSSSSPQYHGMDAYNIMAQKYANHTIADHYAERFARPVCEMLAEYPDVVALVAIADEPENEINDSEYGNHAGGGRAYYGVTQEDMVYFMSRINDVCKEVLPNVARTVASNDQNKSIYNGFDLDLMGHNRYDNNANLLEVEDFKTDAPMIMAEYNIGGESTSLSDEVYTQRLITFREKMMDYGYKGGIQWAWMHDGRHARTAYYLLDTVNTTTPNTDFISTVGDLRHYIDDYRADYRGETVVLDKPVMYCNEGGGYVEWIPSRQATKMDILRSTDGGKTWETILTGANQADYVSKNKGRYKDAATPNSMYKIKVYDDKGNTAESDPTNVAGTEAKFKMASTTVKLEGAIGIGMDSSAAGAYPLNNFGVDSNRPYKAESNVIANGSFESAEGGQWNVNTFITDSVKVISDPTAPEGDKSLYFNSSGNSTEKWYTFTVPVEPNTDYIFSTWVKGAFLSAGNSGHASVGVIDPTTNKFMIDATHRTRGSRANRQIYPTAWDEDWHLRAVSFNTGSLTEVTIALCGENSKMWVDGLALYKNGDGIKYVGERMGNPIKINMSADPLVCKDAYCLTQNSNLSSGSKFWQDGAGWQNGFLTVTTDDKDHGKVLKYTAGDHYGVFYTKWIDVTPNTAYSIAFDIKILKSGAGKLVVLDDYMGTPRPIIGFEFDADIYGDEWGSYYVQFNTGAFTRVGIAVCNEGGEALMDNLRLFKSADGYKDEGGTVGTVATIATTKPTTTRPSTTRPTAGSTTASATAPQPTDPSETVPTDVVADPTAPQLTDPTQPADPTAPADDGEDTHADTTPKKDTPWPVIGIGIGAVVLIGGGIALLLFLRKKKAP